ncbi:MAG: hypothetical protein AAB521_04585 [Patescibacteria group bacterium]
MTSKIIKTTVNSIRAEEKSLLPQNLVDQLQELRKRPSTIGFLEFLTGVFTTGVDKPGALILSTGRLTQALFKGKDFYQQLYSEIQDYRKIGAIPDKKLNSKIGKTLLVELMRSIDEDFLDDEKFEALKTIFLKSVMKDTDEHSQMLAYQYFKVCKRLNSLDILVLRTAFGIFEEPGSNQRHGDIREWEVLIAERLEIPIDLVTQSRLENNGARDNSNPSLYESSMGNNKHGLTSLGIAIGEFIKSIK